VILNQQTYYLDAEDTYRGMKNADMVPNLSPQNLVSVTIMWMSSRAGGRQMSRLKGKEVLAEVLRRGLSLHFPCFACRNLRRYTIRAKFRLPRLRQLSEMLSERHGKNSTTLPSTSRI
jgi:hypothetical protein